VKIVKKILSIIIITVFPLPDFALALTYATMTKDSHHKNHYCEVYKGPCKHGDSCPLKSGKNKTHGHHAEKAHNKHHKKQKSGKNVFTACHKSEKAPILTIFQTDNPFIITELFSGDSYIVSAPLTRCGTTLYTDPFIPLPDKPPSSLNSTLS